MYQRVGQLILIVSCSLNSIPVLVLGDAATSTVDSEGNVHEASDTSMQGEQSNIMQYGSFECE